VKRDPNPNACRHGALAFHGTRFIAIVNAASREFSLAKKIVRRNLVDSHGCGTGETC
jgi:hypothetical protein